MFASLQRKIVAALVYGEFNERYVLTSFLDRLTKALLGPSRLPPTDYRGGIVKKPSLPDKLHLALHYGPSLKERVSEGLARCRGRLA